MSADRLLGLGFGATISDNGSDKVRVTLDARTLSRKAYRLFAVGHYVGNIDALALAQITALGGDECTGFWFDLDLTYSTTTWTSSHRYHPFRQNAIYTYPTSAALRTAADTEDTVFCGYSTANDNTMWNGETLIAAADMLDWYGMACHQTVMFTSNIYPSGAVSNTNRKIVIADIRFIGHFGNNNLVIGFNDSGGNSKGIKFDGCEFYGGGTYLFYLNAGANNVLDFYNCAWVGCVAGTTTFNITARFYNCAFIRCGKGLANGNKANTWVNTISYRPLDGSDCWQGMTNAIVTNIASSDATATGTGAVTNVTRTQMALWSDNDNNNHHLNCRSTENYSLATAGTTGSGAPTEDIDGNDISVASPIGPHKGEKTMRVSWPPADKVLDEGTDNDFVSFAGAQEATAVAKDLTFAEEAARNTDPGAAYVQREADGGPASYKILGVTKTPSLNTAALEDAAYAEGVVAGEANNDFDGDEADISLGKTLTLHGEELAGSRKPAASKCEVYANDSEGVFKGGFQRGERVYADCYLKFDMALAAAEVTVKLYKQSTGLVATLLDAVAYNFAAGVGVDMEDINESLPSYLFGAEDAVGNDYYLELTVAHANLTNGSIESYSSLALMDLPSLSNVLPADTLQDATGTSDKKYSDSEEALRNTVPDLTKIPTTATGGPAAWKQLNVSREGTLNLDTVKSNYESGRNTLVDKANVKINIPYKQFGTDYTGELIGGGGSGTTSKSQTGERRSSVGERT